MRRLAIFSVLLAMGAAGCGSGSSQNPSQQPIVFTADLKASNERPNPVSNAESTATGTATITFSVPRDGSGNITGGGTWNVQAVLNGLQPTSSIILSHIHTGTADVAGGVFVNTGLTAANAIPVNVSGTVNFQGVPISQSEAQTIVANPAGFYFNMHTPLNPGGVVRGQLVRVQ
jgi:CHRD domain